MEQTITDFAVNLTGREMSFTDIATIMISMLLFFAASPINRWLNNGSGLSARISLMRILNGLIIIAVSANILLHQNIYLTRITQSLIVIYFTVLVTQVIIYFIRQRFGFKRKNSDDSISISDTYASRGLSLMVTVLMTIIWIITVLRLMGLNSLLEAGGALGVIGLVLAMTQASWAPDIIAGLIILNSRFFEDGDVIEFNMDGRETIASVFKTKLFHTECLDLANNHRIMVRNARLRDYGVQNLSRFASARGLREVLYFNIDYQHSEQEVTEMIERAFAEFDKAESSREEQHEPEIRVHETGDNAVTWAVYYYIKDVRKLLSIRQLFRSYILAEATRSNISLATPVLHNNSVAMQS